MKETSSSEENYERDAHDKASSDAGLLFCGACQDTVAPIVKPRRFGGAKIVGVYCIHCERFEPVSFGHVGIGQSAASPPGGRIAQ